MKYSKIVFCLVTVFALSAASFSFAHGGGGGGGGHAGNYGREPNTARAAEHPAAQAQARQEEPTEANTQAQTSGRDNEPVRNVVANPFINPAEGNRVEANRYDRAYWNREGYWGDWGWGGDWTTNSPPTTTQPATP